MPHRFHEITFTPLVQAQQRLRGSRQQYARAESLPLHGAVLGEAEREFLGLRDSFYMATVNEAGWPYIQHRGGRPGFVHVLGESLLGLADLRGNKQYISLGNLQHDSRAALFFMDYPHRARLKLLTRVEVVEIAAAEEGLLQKLRPADGKAVVERLLLLHVEAFDWNCPQHITPRYTAAELEPQIATLRERLAALEAENLELRARCLPPA
jgi:predicted pyridoxine 5'-phosphate oxidase superfamily flavin-nucleotide-binding protein